MHRLNPARAQELAKIMRSTIMGSSSKLEHLTIHAKTNRASSRMKPSQLVLATTSFRTHSLNNRPVQVVKYQSIRTRDSNNYPDYGLTNITYEPILVAAGEIPKLWPELEIRKLATSSLLQASTIAV